MKDFRSLCALLETDRWHETVKDAKTTDEQVIIRINHDTKHFLFEGIPLFPQKGTYSHVQASIGTQPYKNITAGVITGLKSYLATCEQEHLARARDSMIYEQLMANAAGLHTLLEHNNIESTLNNQPARRYLQEHKPVFDTLKHVPGLRYTTK